VVELVGYETLSRFTGLPHTKIEFAMMELRGEGSIDFVHRTQISILFEVDDRGPDEVMILSKTLTPEDRDRVRSQGRALYHRGN
jgi:hypothetical protein